MTKDDQLLNRSDIIRMAQEAGMAYRPRIEEFNTPLMDGVHLDELERFAALVAAKATAASAIVEREALEEIDWTALMRQGALVTWGDAETLADRVIAAIRARGETTSMEQI